MIENKSNNNKNVNSKNTISSLFKSLFLYILPHLAILTIFLIYTLIGAAILKEIEIDTLNRPVTSLKKETPSITANYETKLAEEKKQQYQTYLLIKQHQIKLNNLHLNTLLKLKDFQEKIFFNYDGFMGKLSVEVNRSLNLSEKVFNTEVNNENKATLTKVEDEAGKNNTRLLADSDTWKFMSQVYRKQKKNSASSANLFRSIAKHLILFKKDLRANLNKNIKLLIDEFQVKHANLEKGLFDFISEQESLLRENDLGNVKMMSTSEDFNFDEQKQQKNEQQNVHEKLKYTKKTDEINDEVIAEASCDENCDVIDAKSKKQERQRDQQSPFIKSLYFIATLLTTIGYGYGEFTPETPVGKLFIIPYLFVGIPLTLILLSDLGILITRFLKFAYAFLLIFYNDGYVDRFKKLIRKRLAKTGAYIFSFISANKSTTKKTLKLTKLEKTVKINENEQTENNDSKKQQQENVLDLFVEVGVNSLEETDGIFNFSPFFQVSFLIFYLTIGAFYTSRLFDLTLFNAYYFTLITLIKIGMCDDDTSATTNNETLTILPSTVYVLVGVSFFAMTIKNLQESIRQLLINSGENLVAELIKFVNQFGYNLSAESFKLDLSETLSDEKVNSPALSSTSGLEFLLLNQSKSGINNNNNNLSAKEDLKLLDEFKLRSKLPSQFKGLTSFLFDVPKCDKQTQITTLLCSRVKPTSHYQSAPSLIDSTHSSSSKFFDGSNGESNENADVSALDTIKENEDEINVFIDNNNNNEKKNEIDKNEEDITLRSKTTVTSGNSSVESLTKPRRNRFENSSTLTKFTSTPTTTTTNTTTPTILNNTRFSRFK